MNFDLNNTLDSIKDGIIEVADFAHEKTNKFHEKFISKITPDCGKYGDVAKFAAEMLPGVSEYDAIKDGDWQAFAIAAGIDIAALAIGGFTAGTGYAAIKGGTSVAKTGVKVAIREVAEAGAKKVVKETVEASAEKVAKEAVETGVEKVAKETVEFGVKEASDDVVKKTVLEIGEKIDKTKFTEYIGEIQEITKREIPANQKDLIEKALKENDYTKLSKEARDNSKKFFDRNKSSLIDEWEKMTEQEWPKYTEDVLNEVGDVIRSAGQPYDAHHIIELSTSGPNEWWNLHPARFPDEHQKGIHAIGRLARQIFG